MKNALLIPNESETTTLMLKDRPSAVATSATLNLLSGEFLERLIVLELCDVLDGGCRDIQ